MAILFEIGDEQQAWIDERPDVIKSMIAKRPPNRLYLLKSSGHRVFIYSYSENGTVTVVVSGEYNLVMFERRVFGISLDDLEECDLPSDGEPVGSAMTQEDVDENIDALRDMVLGCQDYDDSAQTIN